MHWLVFPPGIGSTKRWILTHLHRVWRISNDVHPHGWFQRGILWQSMCLWRKSLLRRAKVIDLGIYKATTILTSSWSSQSCFSRPFKANLQDPPSYILQDNPWSPFFFRPTTFVWKSATRVPKKLTVNHRFPLQNAPMNHVIYIRGNPRILGHTQSLDFLVIDPTTFSFHMPCFHPKDPSLSWICRLP